MNNPTNPGKPRNDAHQKINAFRNDIRKNQNRSFITTRRFMHSKSYGLQPNFKREMNHLANNPLKNSLLPKLSEWMAMPININNLADMLNAIQENDVFRQHYGIIGIRRILCEHKELPIQGIIDQNAVPRIIQLSRNPAQKHEVRACRVTVKCKGTEVRWSLLFPSLSDMLF